MNPGELGTTGGRPLHQLEVGAEVQIIDAAHHGVDPCGLFRVAGSMVLGPIDWSADDQHVSG